MPVSRRSFLAGCLGAGAFTLLARHHVNTPVHRERWYQFGTLVDVSIAEDDEQRVNTALTQLASEFRQRNHDWHPWKAGLMGDINQAFVRGESIAVDQLMKDMIHEITALHIASDGLFNPAIGRIVALWGFHGSDAPDWQPPEHADIDAVLASRPSPLDLQLNNSQLLSRNSTVQLDLGGYAKGYALKLGMQLLKAAGIENAVINAGGDLVTSGNQGSRPWQIGIRHPQKRGAIAWVESSESEAIFTSGNYERFHEKDGVRYAHILDPKTGRPVDQISSATVIHDNAAFADAAATALVVAGTKDWLDTAAALGIEQAMIVDAHGKVQMTPAMAYRTNVLA
ncbi:MAG: FAD:protein FMN transferase [Chromatiales bacterium]|jgi:thiamine biosynthesis lipoprotein